MLTDIEGLLTGILIWFVVGLSGSLVAHLAEKYSKSFNMYLSTVNYCEV